MEEGKKKRKIINKKHSKKIAQRANDREIDGIETSITLDTYCFPNNFDYKIILAMFEPLYFSVNFII